MSSLEWAAGFYDGEGSTSIHREKNPRSWQNLPDWVTIKMAITQIDPEVLYVFRDAVGCGTVAGPNGPYVSSRPNSKPHYLWQIASVIEVREVLTLLWPYLHKQKKEQAVRCLQEYIESRDGLVEMPHAMSQL